MPHQVLRYRHDPRAESFGDEAVVDSSAMTWDRVLCSAGKRGLEVALAPADLVRLTNAVVAEILAT